MSPVMTGFINIPLPFPVIIHYTTVMGNGFRNFCVSAFVAMMGTEVSAQTSTNAAPKEAPHYPKTSISLMTASRHVGDRTYVDDNRLRRFNEFNPGLGVEHRFTKNLHGTVGGYFNSVRGFTFAAVGGFETDGDKKFGVGAEGGVATGYRYALTPVVLGYARFGKRDHFNVRTNLMPGPGMGVFSLQFRYPLGRSPS